MPLPPVAPAPPASLDELLARAHGLHGHTAGDLARALGVPVPASSRHGKGWVGQLAELALGSTGGARAEPDFAHLGVELKTIPVGPDGRPRESTWVSRVPLLDDQQTWATSAARLKLACVLWLPVEVHPDADLAARRFGPAVLWRPDAAEEALLRADWEDVMELVVLGRSEDLSGHLGECLQVRPKGADARETALGIDADGQPARVAPLGFYLRAGFTAGILARGLAEAG